MSFGAVSIGSGLTIGQTMVLSLLMFSGASQFAFAGVVASGGAPAAAIAASLLLGVRNAFYGVPVSEILAPRGLARLWTAQFVIDETTAMALVSPAPGSALRLLGDRLILGVLWQVGSLAGALVGAAIDPATLGLDAAAPAVFLACVPNLKRTEAKLVALGGVAVALALVPIAPAGIPVVAAGGVAVIAGFTRDRSKPDDEPERGNPA